LHRLPLAWENKSFSMSVQDQITQAANSAAVPAWLALAIAQRESGFNNNAVGSAGEIGIFQLLPSTSAQLGVDPTDPTQNIAGGVAYLAQLLRTFGGDTQKATAAFNCGPTCVANAVAAGGSNWAAFVPSSTQTYVADVTGSLPSSAPPLTQTANVPTTTVPAATPAPAPLITVQAATIEWEPFAWAGLGLVGFLLLRGIAQRI
jgi:membrane-bound lytic murein transglycosylase B